MCLPVSLSVSVGQTPSVPDLASCLKAGGLFFLHTQAPLAPPGPGEPPLAGDLYGGGQGCPEWPGGDPTHCGAGLPGQTPLRVWAVGKVASESLWEQGIHSPLHMLVSPRSAQA